MQLSLNGIVLALELQLPALEFHYNSRLEWIIAAKNLTHIINFHDPSNHENGFLGGYNRLISIFKNTL